MSLESYIIEYRTRRGIAVVLDRELGGFLSDGFWFMVLTRQNITLQSPEEIKGGLKKLICRVPKQVTVNISWDKLKCKDEAGDTVEDLALKLELRWDITDPVSFVKRWRNGSADLPVSTVVEAWRDALRNMVEVEIADHAYSDLAKQVTMAGLSSCFARWIENDVCASIREGISLPEGCVRKVEFLSQSQIQKEQWKLEEQSAYEQREHLAKLESIEQDKKVQEAKFAHELAEIEKDRKLSEAEKDAAILRVKKQQEEDEYARRLRQEEMDKAHEIEMQRLALDLAKLNKELEATTKPVMSSQFADELPPEATDEYIQAWNSRWSGLKQHQKEKLQQFLKFARDSVIDFNLELPENRGVRARSLTSGDVCSERMLQHRDSLAFDFTPPINGYLTVLDLGSSGTVTVLLPNFLVLSNDEKMLVNAEGTYHFPSNFGLEDSQMVVQSESYLYGFEGICVLITPEPLITEIDNNSLTTYCDDVLIKKLTAIQKRLKGWNPEQWAIGLLEFITSPQNEAYRL